MRLSVWVVIVCLAVVGVGCSGQARPGAGAAMEPRLVPDIEISGLKEERVRLREVTHGKVAVIDLWATWCKACKEVSAQAEALARAHPEGDVLVLGLDEGEERDVVAAFLEGRQPSYAIYLDPRLALSDRLGITELPAVVVLDREGRVVRVSKQIDDDLRSFVDKLANAPGPVAVTR